MDRDLEEITSWGLSRRNSIGILITILYETDALLRWRAIEAIGKVAFAFSRKNTDKIRRQIRRLFWMMNDESGSICWFAPEAIGEILFNIPKLIKEYGNILLSFLDEEPFEGGVRWAISRLSQSSGLPGDFKAELQKISNDLIQSLDSDNPKIRGNALLALKSLNQKPDKDRLKRSLGDNGTFEVYNFENGEVAYTKISELAEQYYK
jgi:hypothetical protein